uniref:Uncharacterized protein n=1 Tax=Oryza brachyantha TaxID=4533 RepID=J3M0I6_ORYBR
MFFDRKKQAYLPSYQQGHGENQEHDLERVVPGLGTRGVRRPSELGLDQQHEAEEEPGGEPSNVREVVYAGEYTQRQVDGGDDDQVRHGCTLQMVHSASGDWSGAKCLMNQAEEEEKAYSVAVDGPVGDELREHRAEEAEEGSGGADGDAIPADEEHGEDAPAEAGDEVHQPDLPCRTAETNAGQKKRKRRDILHTPLLLLTESSSLKGSEWGLTESKLLLEADADDEEADHVGEEVDEAGVQPGARLQPPRLVAVHHPVPVQRPVLPQPATIHRDHKPERDEAREWRERDARAG